MRTCDTLAGVSAAITLFFTCGRPRPVAAGDASVLNDHNDGPWPTPRRAVRPKTEAEKAFCTLGDVVEAFITGSAASGSTSLTLDLEELAALWAVHGKDALLAGLERAVAFRRWRAAHVRSILDAAAGTQQVRPAGDALVIELPTVPTRSLSTYKIGDVS